MKSTGCGDDALTSTRPLILLTNDDGIHSPGLLAVAVAVCDLGDLLMVDPHPRPAWDAAPHP